MDTYNTLIEQITSTDFDTISESDLETLTDCVLDLLLTNPPPKTRAKLILSLSIFREVKRSKKHKKQRDDELRALRIMAMLDKPKAPIPPRASMR